MYREILFACLLCVACSAPVESPVEGPVGSPAERPVERPVEEVEAVAESNEAKTENPHCRHPESDKATEEEHGEEEDEATEPVFALPKTTFTCWGRADGYYADVEVDCTLFHYCQTWQFPSGLNETIKWDFACPPTTVFNQRLLSCMLPSVSFNCQDSPSFFWVNERPAEVEEASEASAPESPHPLQGENSTEQHFVIDDLPPQTVHFPEAGEFEPEGGPYGVVTERFGSSPHPESHTPDFAIFDDQAITFSDDKKK